MAMRFVVAFLLCASGSATGTTANPIRKVVNLLQNMQTKITAEGAKKEKLFDKYMCYCSNAEETLGKSIKDAETRIPQLESENKEDIALKKQLEGELKDAKESRTEAKEAVAEATSLREKEAAAYAKVKADSEANIGALSKAIPAIEKGMGGSFLQTSDASVLRRLSVSAEMIPADREILASFLSEGDNYAPKSGEILGILKQLKDEMVKDFEEATTAEEAAIADFESLVAAKKKEIDALTKEIESKTMRVGELAVKLAEVENEIEDLKEQLAEDKKFLADLDKNCELKKAEWAEYKKMEAMEMVALADTIKVLNDDDALELFKKTLPSAASSFLQMKVTSGAMRQQAARVLKSLRTGAQKNDPRLDLIEMAMRGGKIGFDKIIKMIDELVITLKDEQKLDSEKKEYCLAELDKEQDKKKGLEWDIEDLEKAIADAKETIATLTSEIEALVDGIKKLDKAVADATETRKEEHEEYVETLAANAAAKDVLEFAKNRLNKFYNPKLYEAPPKRELSEEDRIVVNMGGTLAPTAAPGGIAGTGIALAQSEVAPPPPPEANLAYKKAGGSSNGVISMIDILIADLDKDNQIMEVEEKDSQKEYEGFMSDSAEKRALDSKAIGDKEGDKAETETALQTDEESKKSKMIEAMETAKTIAGLHNECDWLLKYYDARASARTGEIDALGKAKDVLSGADYSLIQTASSHLRGAQ
jgi:septal ring factor EnvC (AmiA/AmiB activator)|eukprot:CAMPEP_0169125026 /NCGR_PEP_ID=MMETSP1015-20121227/34648_1 /TAXON_ID=342587 /ORGANISM="Karlodinium micrum, Strain CCMP2283" /LENGTH=705 /DNA_ID=CAMNT_0009188501 /DNA_START=58 /DNA_END=2175 /DNA_ORIENTATION=+